MLNAIHISHVFVFDQDQALDFYVGKLGLEVSNDQDLGFMRWLTVRVPGQPGPDILLEKPGPPAMDEATARQVRELISKGASGFAIGFTTKDCRKTYQTLLAKGVEFTQEPVEQPYGTDVGLRGPVRQPHPDRATEELVELFRRQRALSYVVGQVIGAAHAAATRPRQPVASGTGRGLPYSTRQSG